ncbi:S41 family peptidase [Flavobacterium branchiophilum]|uniref:Probable S41 family peptidase n=1 Tax=Flavobacterium branchiophilum (strain FL-15) TaxID=1034807 RepID=G2Z7G1_FLABF|nr:S41 family peptidase [Flavobacterium branchiophilum]CCB69066.1 Probable S41 family peptidase [Flavobacterium branchiophilum FL-15]
MCKKILGLIVLIQLCGCSSIKQHNAQLIKPLSIEKIKEDIDFTYTKMQRMHPKLYWYISKKDLDYKFDSLKTSIKKPLTPYELYTQLSPLVAAIKQGHSGLSIPRKQYTKKEIAALNKKGKGPFSQLEMEYLDQKLYIVKNNSLSKNIPEKSEILSINKHKIDSLAAVFEKRFASDGFNKTFKYRKLGKSIGDLYTSEFGLQDSLLLELKSQDSIKWCVVKRLKPDTSNTTKKKTEKQPKTTTVAKKAKKLWGYDSNTKNFSRNLHFLEKDSSIAVLKINRFRYGNYKKCYQYCFDQIQQLKSKTLILDLRDNPGGSLAEIVELYSYLADSSFVFLQKSDITSRFSLYKYGVFSGKKWYQKTLKIISTPFTFGYFWASTHKNANGQYYYNMFQNQYKPKSKAFKGYLYVLVNGGSFSASCLISNELKESKRATIVGNETGGAANGTVAGIMPEIMLPHSKLKMHLGLIACIAAHQTPIEGRGVMPHQVIIPTIEDRYSKKDPEMEWVLNNLKKPN